MTIKQHGGVFGRNPSFNDVEVESLTIAGNAVPDASTILVDGDIGSTVQGYDADTAKYDDATANFTGTLQNGGSDVLVDTDIGSTVQGYDADTAKLDVAQTFSASQTFTSTVNIESADELQLAFQIGGLTYGHFRMDSADLVVGTGTTGIKFYDFATAIAPATASTGALINNSLDLGSSSFNWRSAYIGTSVIMANGAGIDFSATAGTGTSELFDDYEEGTWTPSLGGTTTYTIQTGTYTKCGRLIFVNLTLLISSIGTGSASAISGLPYAASGSIAAINVGTNTNSVTNFYSISGSTGASGTAITMRGQDSLDSGLGTINVFGNGTYLEMSGVYETAT